MKDTYTKIETFKMRPKKRPEMDTDLALPNVPPNAASFEEILPILQKMLTKMLAKVALHEKIQLPALYFM